MRFFIIAIVLTIVQGVSGQVVPLPNIQTSTYVSIDDHSEKIHRVIGNLLSFRFYDQTTESGTVHMELRDYRNESLGKYSLRTSPGQNYYDIQLPYSWLGKSGHFTAVIFDHKGKQNQFHFKLIRPAMELLSTQIQSNPNKSSCEHPETVELNFQGKIEGIGPFHIKWFFLDSFNSRLLRDEIEETLSEPGYTNPITVYGQFDFIVVMYTQDSCGNEKTNVLSVTCTDNERQDHTIQFQPLNNYNPELLK